MNEKIYIISDIEMGNGEITDDFSDDLILTQFIESIKSTNDEKITLILNGDTFDFLKMPYLNSHPRYITEKISLWKLDQVFNNHPLVFRALKNFLQKSNHRIHFIIGNHDADLIWPALQEKLQSRLSGKKRVTFGFNYKNHNLHVEHGHMEDPFFSINKKTPITKYRDLQILNLPWGAQACFSHLIKIKKQFPKEECLYPKTLALKQNPTFNAMSKKTGTNLFLKSLLLEPIIHPSDPTYRIPYLKFLKHFLHFGFNVVDDKKLLKAWSKKIIKNNPTDELFILGHAHVLTDTQMKGKRIIITDTWRDEFNLLRNKEKKPKTYAHIHLAGGQLIEASLNLYNPNQEENP